MKRSSKQSAAKVDGAATHIRSAQINRQRVLSYSTDVTRFSCTMIGSRILSTVQNGAFGISAPRQLQRRKCSKCPIVLVVEYEELIQEAFAEILKERGFEPVEASGMDDAAALILHDDVDVVVTEDVLLDGNGLELCRQFKANRRFQWLPFILWTAHEIPPDRLRRAGINLLAGRQFDIPALLMQIKQLAANYREWKKNLRRIAVPQPLIKAFRFARLTL